MNRSLSLAALALAGASSLQAQSVLDRSPNIAAEWRLRPGQAVFNFSHRFELLRGGDELINLPTLTLGIGLPAGLAAGLDYTSNSEIVSTRLGGNETQWWLARAVRLATSTSVDVVAAYNTMARSVDGALTARQRAGPFTMLVSARAYSDLFGSNQSRAAGTAGLVLHLTPHLTLSGDAGRVVQPDSFATVWSGGVGVAIPGTRHTFTIHATNSGAATLQGAVRTRVLGEGGTRYGFTFSAPLGSRAQWARVFRGATALASIGDSVAARVEMRALAFTPPEIRVRVGDLVEWVNADPLVHNVTADRGEWISPMLQERQVFRHRFTEAGIYTYHCEPHPQMTGTVIVLPGNP